MQNKLIHENWTVRRADEETAYPAVVPGCVHEDLLRVERLPPLFWRDNERAHDWVCDHDWVFRTSFPLSADEMESDRLALRFHGIDTLATVELNGALLFKADNMYRIWEADIKKAARAGENELVVTCHSPVPYMEKQVTQDRSLYHWNRYDERFRGKSYLRKMPCSFGWDWGPKGASCGLWKPVELIARNTGSIQSVHFTQTHTVDDVRLNGCVSHDAAESARVSVELLGPEGELIVSAEHSANEDIEIIVENPQLWWPLGMGDQPLYRVEVRLLEAGCCVDVWSRRLGLRCLELDQSEDEWGRAFQFVVNGIPFFCKGSNWIPLNVFPASVTDAEYRRWIGDAVAANHNMLRVWGGGIYESDLFYDLCDEAGILIWQDFMFACSTYPTYRSEFLENVAQEVADQVERLRHHACIALWCGNNEIEQGMVGDAWTDTSMSWEDYSRLFDEKLPQWLTALDEDRPYWPCSPHTPVGDRLDFNDPTSGDAHCWDVWFAKKPFEHQRTWEHRFMSEFGFQSFPELKTCETFCEARDLNLTSYVMDFHQRSPSGNQTIMMFLLDWFRLPKDLDSTLWMTQVTQALCVAYATEHGRRLQPRMMGILYWQFNDLWPAATWSSIDCYGRWKALHYMSKRFFADQLVSICEDLERQRFSIHLSNQGPAEWKGELRWKLVTVSGECLEEQELAACAGSQQSVELVPSFSVEELTGDHEARELLIFAELSNSDGVVVSRNMATLARPKHLDLPATDIEYDVREEKGRTIIDLHARKVALYIRLQLSEDDAVFGDNCFHMAAGDTYQVAVERGPDAAKIRKQLRISSLVDTY